MVFIRGALGNVSAEGGKGGRGKKGGERQLLIVCEVIIDRLPAKGPQKCFKGVRRHAQGSK